MMLAMHSKKGSNDTMKKGEEVKKCPSCLHVKPLDDFGPNKKNKDGRQSWCQLCKARDTRDHNKRNPERKKEFDKKYRHKNKSALNFKDRQRYYNDKSKARRNNLKTLYGITPEDYDMMFMKQGGRCAICRSKNSNHPRLKVFVVDHHHGTGEIRGLLCFKCNSILGYCNDSTEYLLKLIAYLHRTDSAIECFTLNAPRLTKDEFKLIDGLAKNGWRRAV